jgi:hypothetical protein
MRPIFNLFNGLFQAFAFDTEWVSGRQVGGYKIKQVFSCWFLRYLVFDILLIKYTEGTEIPPHRDPEVGLRFNFVWKNSAKGGEFHVRGKKLKIGPLIIFNPRNTHYVTKVTSGSRHVFSIGFGSGVAQSFDFGFSEKLTLSPEAEERFNQLYVESLKKLDKPQDSIYISPTSQQNSQLH